MHRIPSTLLALALLVYVCLGLAMIAQQPGLYYDEALLVSGGVHLSHSSTQFPLEHAPHTWVCGLGPCFPLMAEGRYIGPIKEYIAWPLFKLFGPQPATIRIISLLLGAVGIWGLANLLAHHASRAVSAVVAFALAVNPAYISQNVFDNGAVGAMMAAFGLFCFAVSRYLQTPGILNAALLGASAGFGVWSRANFVWILAAAFGAALIVLRRKVLVPAAHVAAIVLGGLAGGAPFLVYQILSRGGTWEAVNLLSSHQPLRSLLFSRLVLFSESLLSDREHRIMWGMAIMPGWQRWFFVSVVAWSCAVCWLVRSGSPKLTTAARVSSLALLFLGILLFSTRMDIAEHHLVSALPLAATVVVLACALLLERLPYSARFACVALALIYFASAVYWNARTIQGLSETGGQGLWSDATYQLADVIQRDYPHKEIKILGWGFEHNLYVLSDGKLNLKELFWGASAQAGGLGASWTEEIRRGGVFLVPGPETRVTPDYSQAFLKAVGDARPLMKAVTVTERSGATYAQILEIEPDSLGKQERDLSVTRSELLANAPDFDQRASGFYSLEDGNWRWAGRRFSVMLDSPHGIVGRTWLVMRLFIPEGTIAKNGSVTLVARINGHDLMPQTFTESGAQIFQRLLESDLVPGTDSKIEFGVDHLLAGDSNKRELGVVFSGVSLMLR